MGYRMVVEGRVSTFDATAGEGISGKVTIELILIEKKKPATVQSETEHADPGPARGKALWPVHPGGLQKPLRGKR